MSRSCRGALGVLFNSFHRDVSLWAMLTMMCQAPNLVAILQCRDVVARGNVVGRFGTGVCWMLGAHGSFSHSHLAGTLNHLLGGVHVCLFSYLFHLILPQDTSTASWS